MDLVAELKFKLNLDVKKKFNMRIALAKKAEEATDLLEKEMRDELKRIEREQSEISSGKRAEIKASYNDKCLSVQIDVDRAIEYILKGKNTPAVRDCEDS